MAPHFDNYVVLKELGHGGMGAVYLARETSGLDRLVVIKAVRGDWENHELAVTRFLEEARITARLVHPNIVAIHALGRSPTGPYLVLEHVHGQSLAAVLAASSRLERPIPLPVVLQIGIELCKALHFAHNYVDEQGRSHCIVHRDLKPANVLITYDGRVKLIDFGIAKSDMSLLKTQTGMFQGTAPYVSPEQARCRPVDHRSDIFSLGTVLYEAMSGISPFRREDLLGTLNAIVNAEVPPANREGGEELAEVLLRALHKDPESRFATALEFQIALEMCLLAYQERHAQAEDNLEVYLSRLFPDRRLEIPPDEPEPYSRLQTTAPPTTPAPHSRPPNPRPEPAVPLAAAGAPSVPVADASRLQVVEDRRPAGQPPARPHWPLLAAGALLLATGLAGLAWWLRTPPAATAGTDPSPSRRAGGRHAEAGLSAARQSLPDARVTARPDSAPPPAGMRPPHRPSDPRRPAPTLARLQVRTAPPASIRFGGNRRSGQARFALQRPLGLIQIDGPFTLLLRYRASREHLQVTVDSRPWCIAYPGGMSPRRVPLGGIAVTGSERRIDFRRPGTTEEMSIWLRRD